MQASEQAERARFISNSVPIGEDQGRGFGERSQQDLDESVHLVGVNERPSLFQQSVERVELDGKIRKEICG